MQELKPNDWVDNWRGYEADGHQSIVVAHPMIRERFLPGDVVVMRIPKECSACITTKGDHSLHDNVRVKNITDLPDGWHGYWWCPWHWDRYSKNTESRVAATPAEKLARGTAMVREGLRLIEEASNVCAVCHEVRALSGACSC